MEPTVKYRCGECGETHNENEDALECCPHHVHEIYYCGRCGKEFGSIEELADECCEELGPDAPPYVSPEELEAAGQMRLSI